MHQLVESTEAYAREVEGGFQEVLRVKLTGPRSTDVDKEVTRYIRGEMANWRIPPARHIELVGADEDDDEDRV